ncbi:hypothetical protein [Algoriphagus marinus]|uniref:hypothetical protein n=1 Tax=Algoriphagus marinus TaxID=1925762 RepID=UPI00094BA62B|nr:hypothetical protein [Algoriphagus marinus]
MKSKPVILFSFILGCHSPQVEKNNLEMTEIRSLSELINENLNSDIFYKLYEFEAQNDGLIFILPNSSCFNCFEELNSSLKMYFDQNPTIKLYLFRNDKLKEREIRYSLQSVLPLEQIQIFDITDYSFLSQHEFFPKLGYFKKGRICCLEVFEQGDYGKIRNYFDYLDFRN